MIKKQQKWIALLVTLTFMGLLQVSTMPMTAANAPEQISSANSEQAPNFIEEEGDSSYQSKKKSIMPVILIGVGVAAVAAVLFLVVLKTKYDITGAWTDHLEVLGLFPVVQHHHFHGRQEKRHIHYRQCHRHIFGRQEKCPVDLYRRQYDLYGSFHR